MIATRRVADRVWLGVSRARDALRLRGSAGRRADCAAAGQAWCAALRATGLSPESAVVSRAHTQGSGAAIVGPAGMTLGVDLVVVERITLRHARAILDPREWHALPAGSGMRPALAWGLKEAAAKALGDPGRCFPAGLRITWTSQGVGVIGQGDPGSVVFGHWERMGELLCVWVLGSS